jgi:hypothetical protein
MTQKYNEIHTFGYVVSEVISFVAPSMQCYCKYLRNEDADGGAGT